MKARDSKSVNKEELKQIQSSFAGGMRRDIDPTKLELEEYALLVNGRNRYGTIKPIKRPLRISEGLPTQNNASIDVTQIQITDGYAEIVADVGEGINLSTIKLSVDGIDVTVTPYGGTARVNPLTVGADGIAGNTNISYSGGVVTARFSPSPLWGFGESHRATLSWATTSLEENFTNVYVIYYLNAPPYTQTLPPDVDPGSIFKIEAQVTNFNNEVVILELPFTVDVANRTVTWRPDPGFDIPYQQVGTRIYSHKIGETRSQSKIFSSTTTSINTNSNATGNYQSGYAAGSFGVVFVDGRAFYRDFNDPNITNFRLIPGLQLSRSVPIIWAELVPASNLNFVRTATSTNSNDPINLTSSSNPTPQCMVVQDGINQPWVIFPDGQARVTQNWAEWSLVNDQREYIPIGKQMAYVDGILYVVSPSGSEIYRSVFGRPLDFIIAVDGTGNKLTEIAASGASAMSHRVDYELITAISRTNSNDGSFVVSTAKSTWLVTPDYETLIYGEPQFNNKFLFSTGAVNQFSFADVLGDVALIDLSGIRSFNAVLQLANEGRNSPFSASVFPLFEGVIQNKAAAHTHDNYAFFAVSTVYGKVILVYDTLKQKFAAMDIFDNVDGEVKQFFEVKTATIRRFFFLTDSGVYEYFAGQTAACQLYTKELCSNDPEVEQVPVNIKVVFNDIKESGVLSVTPFYDRLSGTEIPKKVRSLTTRPLEDLVIPFGQSTVDTSQSLMFKVLDPKACWKLGWLIEFNFEGDLSHISYVSRPKNAPVSSEQAAISYE
jgi:hypothetical protein